MISIKINENDNNKNTSNQKNLHKIPRTSFKLLFFLENVHSAKIINMISRKKKEKMI